MASTRLSGRVAQLEQESGGFVPYTWIIVRGGEPKDEALARYERENGPLGDNPKLFWICTGVPRRGVDE